MTLIITCAQPTSVVQVSDRRLVNPDTGQVVDEHAQKAIYVECADARFALAYTGIARIHGKTTNEWLLGALAELGPIGQMPTQDV